MISVMSFLFRDSRAYREEELGAEHLMEDITTDKRAWRAEMYVQGLLQGRQGLI